VYVCVYVRMYVLRMFVLCMCVSMYVRMHVLRKYVCRYVCL